MNNKIIERFNIYKLDKILSLYGLDKNKTKILNSVENLVFECEKNNNKFILRVNHDSVRSEILIIAELNYINYLSKNNICVSNILLSQAGHLVEKLEDSSGGFFLVTVFYKIKGYHPKPHQWSNFEFIQRLGQSIGKLHAVSKNYIPSTANHKRLEWNDPEFFQIQKILPSSETKIIDKYFELEDYLNSLPKDRDCYGLIHNDLWEDNYFIDEKKNFTFIDFDESCYCWFIHDIAFAAIACDSCYMKNYFKYFFRGYNKENRIDQKWLKEIPFFF